MAATSTIRMTARSGAHGDLGAFGNDKSLLWPQINRAIFKIDDEVPLQDEEELVVVVMFVPVVFALHDSRRTTESFTLQSVWLYHFSVQAFTRAGTLTKWRGGNSMSR